LYSSKQEYYEKYTLEVMVIEWILIYKGGGRGLLGEVEVVMGRKVVVGVGEVDERGKGLGRG
jgi:hypothetical protein